MTARRRGWVLGGATLSVGLSGALGVSPALAQPTGVTFGPVEQLTQSQDQDQLGGSLSLSADGSVVAFDDRASDIAVNWPGLAPSNVYVKRGNDPLRLAYTPGQAPLVNGAGAAAVSADGRYVSYVSQSSRVVPGDTNGVSDFFVFDNKTRTTELVSRASDGQLANAEPGVYDSGLSGDGRFVVFASAASNLVPGDTNGVTDVFVRDRLRGTTERISVSSTGKQGQAPSTQTGRHATSVDGRYVVFSSEATNLVPGDTNRQTDIFLRDRLRGTTELITVSTSGEQGHGSVYGFQTGAGSATVSDDGRFVAFASEAENLDRRYPPDARSDVFVRDRRLHTTTQLSVKSGVSGGSTAADSQAPVISGDGRAVCFGSNSPVLGVRYIDRPAVFIAGLTDRSLTMLPFDGGLTCDLDRHATTIALRKSAAGSDLYPSRPVRIRVHWPHSIPAA